MKAIITVFLAAAAAVFPVGHLEGAEPGASRPLVCIDPGHGGNDPGAVACGLEEKSINLDMALKAKPIVQSMGFDVMMTRESDVYVSLADRCAMANRARATIFVSVHNNAYESSSRGTETYCYYSSTDGRKLATCVHNEVVRRLQRPDRGVKEAGFYVLHHTDMTSALVEGAFLTNPEEARLLSDPVFRQSMAEGVAAGIGDYLADPGQFDEYISLMNTDEGKVAETELTFMNPYGGQHVLEQDVPPRSRITIRVNDHFFKSDVSTTVKSRNGVPIVAERAMYFDFEKGRGGSGAPGVTAPTCTWYLAEGSTAWGFSTFVLIQNPYRRENTVYLDFMCDDGSVYYHKVRMAPRSRYTVDPTIIKGLEKRDFSMKVHSTYPVIVERSMYFEGPDGMAGGHVSPGATRPRLLWYLAEGYTGKGFDTYVLLCNPGAQPALSKVTFMLPDGAGVEKYYQLPAFSRKTIHMNEVPGLENSGVAARVDCDRPIVVERSMYFNYNGIREGSNTVAAPAAGKSWYLSEGSTRNGFDTYILLLNPGNTDAVAALHFMSVGDRGTYGIRVPARSRRTVWLNRVNGLENAEVSTHVTSTRPIVVERSMYFQLGYKSGGQSVMGVTQPATEWYFAEGCTR